MTEAVSKKKKVAKRSAGPEIAPGIEVPEGVNRYRIMRCDPVHPYHPRRPCGTPENGLRVDTYDIAERGLPRVDQIRTIWGSGTYRFQWFRGIKAGGFSPHLSIDDPAHPMRPEYTPAPEVTAPAPPPAPPPVSNPLLEVLKTQADGAGKVDLATTLVFLQAMTTMERSQRAEAEQQHQRWREEDDRRAQRREEDHRREIERERERAESERASLETFWQRQNEQAAELRRAARGEDVDEELGELGDAVRTLAEAQKETAKQTQDMWGRIIDMVAPAVPSLLQRFAGPAALKS